MTVKQKNELLQKMTKPSGRKSVVSRPPVEELSELYSQMTAVQVGEHYGVPASTVRNWIAFYRKKLRESNKGD